MLDDAPAVVFPIILLGAFAVVPPIVRCEPTTDLRKAVLNQRPELKTEYPLDSGAMMGVASISIRDKKVTLGSIFKVEVRFQAGGGGGDFYNVFFSSLEPQPGLLAVFNEKDEYVGDLLAWEGGSRAGPCSWTYIPGGAYVGRELAFNAGNVPRTRFSKLRGRQLLPPGRYKLQLILLERVLAARDRREGLIERTDEVARSKVVEIEFTEPDKQE